MGRRPGKCLTRADIVAASVAIVRKSGREALGGRALARSLGVQPSSLYHHISCQEDLLCDVAIAGWERLLGAVVGEPLDLRQVAQRYRAFALAEPELYLLMTSVPMGGGRSEPMELAEQALVMLGLPAGDHRPLRALRAALHGFVHLELIGQLRDDPDDAFEWLLETVLAGLHASSRQRD